MLLYICDMKKTSIWILGGVMGVSFCVLLLLQFSYIKEMTTMRQQQFDESVKRSLYEVVHILELEETKKYLEKDLADMERNAAQYNPYSGFFQQQVTFPDGSTFSVSQEISSSPQPNTIPSLQMPRPNPNSNKTVTEKSRTLQQDLLKRYISQKALIDEVIYSMLNTASGTPLAQRIDYGILANELTAELKDNGIELPFHFVVTTTSGRIIYTCGCKDFDPKDLNGSYSQTIFRNDSPNKMGVIRVYFPTLHDYIDNSVSFMIPSLIFMGVLLITFLFTLFIVFRQKKLTEIKNDFINNMTHEFKTPISTISLAAQMLNDPSVAKSPVMFKHISGVINDETKRLRFQVEKVLQMSMFDKQKATLKMKEIDANEMIAGVINTFTLKVERYNGKITSSLDAEDSVIFADEMHITNVIFNLMDNAVKYKRPDEDLLLDIRTWNEAGKLMISVQDNGIGIKKENLKKVFEKFYRVHTGNLHDVKGFGLGLAYVKKIIQDHKGSIRAESELNVGTKFIIALPLLKNE